MAILPTIEYDASETIPDDLPPSNGQATALTVSPTKTWRFNNRTGRIEDEITDEDALEQFVVKALRTARNRFMIYDHQYGNDIEDMIGTNVTQALAQAEIPRLVREALIYDDRVLDVKTRIERRVNDKLYVHVTVDSVYGALDAEVAYY